MALSTSRKFRALPRDRSRRQVTEDLQFAWRIIEGEGSLTSSADQEVRFVALYAEEKLKSGWASKRVGDGTVHTGTSQTPDNLVTYLGD